MQTTIVVDNELGKVTAISSWHPINGEWVKIDQIFKDEDIQYYTNGELINKPIENPDLTKYTDIIGPKDDG